MILTTFTNELLEVSCVSNTTNGENGSQQQQQGNNEDDEENEMTKYSGLQSTLGLVIGNTAVFRHHHMLGLDIKRIVRSSQLNPNKKDNINLSLLYQAVSNPDSNFTSIGYSVSSLCRVSSGFLSCGGDGTLRLYQASEGQPHLCSRVIKLGLETGSEGVESLTVMHSY
jgi:hypothetical protein